MNLKYQFEKFSRNNTLLCIVMLVLGAVLFLWPGKSLIIVVRILGAALPVCLAAGLILLVSPAGRS